MSLSAHIVILLSSLFFPFHTFAAIVDFPVAYKYIYKRAIVSHYEAETFDVTTIIPPTLRQADNYFYLTALTIWLIVFTLFVLACTVFLCTCLNFCGCLHLRCFIHWFQGMRNLIRRLTTLRTDIDREHTDHEMHTFPMACRSQTSHTFVEFDCD